MILINTGNAVGGGSATTGWNAADKDTSVTLSNGSPPLTVTATTGGYRAVRAIASASSGKKYFEFHLDTDPSGELIIVGIANAAANLSTDFIGQNNNGIGYDPGGSLIIINGATTAIQGGTIGDTIGIAVDIGNTKFWCRTNGGNWNNSGTDNPSTNTGGRTFSTMAAGPYFPAAAVNSNLSALTANFGGSAYAHFDATVSGFTNW